MGAGGKKCKEARVQGCDPLKYLACLILPDQAEAGETAQLAGYGAK